MLTAVTTSTVCICSEQTFTAYSLIFYKVMYSFVQVTLLEENIIKMKNDLERDNQLNSNTGNLHY